VSNTRVTYVASPPRAHNLLVPLKGVPVAPLKTCRRLLRLAKFSYAHCVVSDAFGRWVVLGFTPSMMLRVLLVIRLCGEFFYEQFEKLATMLAETDCVWRQQYRSILKHKNGEMTCQRRTSGNHGGLRDDLCLSMGTVNDSSC
jgi:hypothetical protein